jgi:hypothetical protein
MLFGFRAKPCLQWSNCLAGLIGNTYMIAVESAGPADAYTVKRQLHAVTSRF